MKEWLRNDLKDYIPYNATDPEYNIKLNANESPFNMPDKVKDNIIKWIKEKENLNIYPDTDCTELRIELAKFWNVQKQNIICGVGSDQMIDYICKAFLEVDDIVLVPSPSFSMYTLTAKLNKAKVINIAFDDNFEYNTDYIIQLCNKYNPKLLFICTPNNPTGKSINIEDIKKILNNTKCPVILDEAYAEFNDKTMIPFINDYKNIIILRTFSKAYSLAGIRVGYAVANEDAINCIEIVKTPYNLNTLSQKIAIEVLKNVEIYKERIDYLKSERDWLFDKLKAIDYIKAYSSDANFIYVESKIDIAKKLLNSGILIRAFNKQDDLYRFRISIGTRQQNEELIKNL